MATLNELYSRFAKLRFPDIGKTVGDFGLYESFLAGVLDRARGGDPVDRDVIPLPDDETAEFVASLRAKTTLDDAEAEFLEYFDLMEEMVRKLTDAKGSR